MQPIPIVATPTESIIMPNDSEYQMYILANYWRHVKQFSKYIWTFNIHAMKKIFKCRWAHIFLQENLMKEMHPPELKTKTEDM